MSFILYPHVAVHANGTQHHPLDQQLGLPKLLHLCRIYQHGLRSRLPRHDQIRQDTTDTQPREILEPRRRELGKGDDALELQYAINQTQALYLFPSNNQGSIQLQYTH